jgi:polysaccharide export outer membrane protein
VPAAGLTPAAIEGSVAKRLADGFLANPTVTVNVEEYKSQRIFVVGEVRQPGPYPLTGRMTLIEMLALVRSTTAEASKQAIVVRPRHVDAATGPTLPAPGSDVAAEVMKINLQALETGDLSNNIELRDGDTIFVPRAETVVVFGQVRSPGVYPISPTTTIVQLLAQAGGVTDRGAANRIKIVRMTNGRKREFTAKLDDLVNAGDTIIIPDRLF